jgi:signal transduction histidine kinase
MAIATLALAWIGSQALGLEAQEARLRQQARLDENLQLALWRMDSALAPLLSEEGTRPYYVYSSFYPAEKAYTQLLEGFEKGEVLVASPLLTYRSPRIRLHFEFAPSGLLTSPQVPDGNMRDLAETRYITSEQLEESALRLEELRALVSVPAMTIACAVDSSPTLLPDQISNQFPGGPAASQEAKEYVMRSRNATQARASGDPSVLSGSAVQVGQGPVRAAWIGSALILGRQVRLGKLTYLQGCWLDWDAIRTDLIASVSDLLTQADLVPIGEDDDAPTRRLAALPVRLEGHVSTGESVRAWSPVWIAMAVGWVGLAIAGSAVAFLLSGALALSERRATFVSAVTHELRTPLTTFRMYTEMLAEDMVPDASVKSDYLRILRKEANRLGHLVENVLSFARLERGRMISASDALTAHELVERMRPTLEEKARGADMTLVVENADPAKRLRTDASVVEQIMFNLVDNATKYASRADDKRIHLVITSEKNWLRITLRDHGPGLCRETRRQLFHPFSKSVDQAARSAPGVGLGLALSRRLARSLGGTLKLAESQSSGTAFCLSLPVASQTEEFV